MTHNMCVALREASAPFLTAGQYRDCENPYYSEQCFTNHVFCLRCVYYLQPHLYRHYYKLPSVESKEKRSIRYFALDVLYNWHSIHCMTIERQASNETS